MKRGLAEPEGPNREESLHYGETTRRLPLPPRSLRPLIPDAAILRKTPETHRLPVARPK